MTQEQLHKEIRDLITNRIKVLNPTCLIRDVRYENHEELTFRYTFTKVRKDDTWVKGNIAVEIIPIRITPSGCKVSLKIIN
jgi:hypothetical protein